MKVDISYKKELERVSRDLDDLQRKYVPRAANRTNNSVAVTARKEAVSELKDEMGKATGLSAGGFRKSLDIKRSTVRTLRAEITANGKPLPLIRFGARKAAKGVRAKAWNKRKLYKGAFIAKMPNGKRGVFKRTSKKRLPIKELYGPGIPSTFLERPVQDALQRVINKTWRPRFQRDLANYLKRFNG